MLVEKWDRKRAYDFLSKKAPRETVVKYLEFIINNWSETGMVNIFYLLIYFYTNNQGVCKECKRVRVHFCLPRKAHAQLLLLLLLLNFCLC